MKKNKFYFDGSNASFADVLNAMKGIFNVDVLPYLKGEKQQTYLYHSFRAYEENVNDLLPAGSSELQRAIDEGWIDILESAMLKNNSFNYLGNLWDKMRTYFLDNAATKTFSYNPITYKYTVTDKPKVIVLPPTIGTDTGTGTGASNPTGTGASGTNTGIVLPITPQQDASRDAKIAYFTQLGNSKGYTWEQGFKRDWYALVKTLNILDQPFIKAHVDFMIKQQKSNPTGAKDNTKDEIQDFKQAVEFVPTVNRNKFKIKKGFLFYLFASPKVKAAIKAEEEKKYNEAVQQEEREFIQAENNTMQKNANIKKLIKDKTIVLTPYLTALNDLNKAPKPKNNFDTNAIIERQKIVDSLANLQIVKDSPKYKLFTADFGFKNAAIKLKPTYDLISDILNSKVNEINGQINELKKQLK
jgi:hypothetical protein